VRWSAELIGRSERAGNWIVEFSAAFAKTRREADKADVIPSGDQNLAVGKQGGCVAEAGRNHAAGRGECSCGLRDYGRRLRGGTQEDQRKGNIRF
jgi:hypothetical protein